jgi:nitroreductase/ketosteroid isomerase-like protein
MKGLVLLFFLFLPPFLLCCSAATAENRSGLSLRETFDIYVKSVQTSDLKTLFSTVTEGEDFFFLTADGKMIDREGYYKFHQDWFKQTGWEMPVDLLKVQEGKDYGYVNAIFYYRQKTPDDRTYNLESYFTLIFRQEDGLWKVVADVCTPIKRYISVPGTEITYDTKQEYIFDVIKTRRTVRKYKSTPVPEEHITRILDAARFAPTSGNQQPWKFVVIQNRSHLDSLERALQSSWEERIASQADLDDEKKKSYIGHGKTAIGRIMTAPLYVMVFVDTTVYADDAVWDGCLAVENLMLAARALGYGTGFFTSYFPEEVVKSFVKAPENVRFICATPVGIPEEWPQTPEKKRLDEFVVYESFEGK